MEASFSDEQLRRVLGSSEAKALLALLRADGGAAMQQAADALRRGDQAQARAILQPLLQTPQAQALLRTLNG